MKTLLLVSVYICIKDYEQNTNSCCQQALRKAIYIKRFSTFFTVARTYKISFRSQRLKNQSRYYVHCFSNIIYLLAFRHTSRSMLSENRHVFVLTIVAHCLNSWFTIIISVTVSQAVKPGVVTCLPAHDRATWHV